MMRLNVKVALLFLLSIGILTVVILYSFCGNNNKEWQKLKYNAMNNKAFDLQVAEEIDCDINGEYEIGCRKEGDEVYIPFSFLHKYFEVYGKLATYDGLEKFEWSHSYSKVYTPKEKYEPREVFMSFENYNVEVNENVFICIYGINGRFLG